MDEGKEIGIVQKVPYKMKQVEWTIPDIFSREELFQSPSFSFPGTDVLWHLELRPKWHEINNNFIQAYIVCEEEEREYEVEYYFGLKKRNGSVEHIISGTLDSYDNESDGIGLIRKINLFRRSRYKLARNKSITIIFTMKFKTDIKNAFKRTASKETRPLKLIRLNKLSESFKDIFADKETCDVTLKVQDREYKAHRSVLMARSTVFTAILKHDALEKQTRVITISDCDPNYFQEFLDYLYCGKLEELSLRSVLSLHHTSDKYAVAELKAFCIEYLMNCLTVKNVCEIAVLVDKYEEKLFSEVQNFFNKNYIKVLLTSEWKHSLKNNHNLADKLLTGMAKMQCKEASSDVSVSLN